MEDQETLEASKLVDNSFYLGPKPSQQFQLSIPVGSRSTKKNPRTCFPVPVSGKHVLNEPSPALAGWFFLFFFERFIWTISWPLAQTRNYILKRTRFPVNPFALKSCPKLKIRLQSQGIKVRLLWLQRLYWIASGHQDEFHTLGRKVPSKLCQLDSLAVVWLNRIHVVKCHCGIL